jgi:hypothetical protein
MTVSFLVVHICILFRISAPGAPADMSSICGFPFRSGEKACRKKTEGSSSGGTGTNRRFSEAVSSSEVPASGFCLLSNRPGKAAGAAFPDTE